MAPQSSPPSDPAPGGTEYSNPPVADGINNPPESQLKSFFVNLSIVAGALALLFVVLNLAAVYLTPCIPMRWEKAVVGNDLLGSTLTGDEEARQERLRRLARKVAAALDMPPDLEVTVFYNPGPTVNALATLGGTVLVFRGLLDMMGSEDELAMVLAHEMAHVKHRDPIKGLARASGFLLLSLGMQDDGAFVGQATTLGLAGYSRGQESDADREAVAALAKLYGHAGGAAAFFTRLAREVEKRRPDEKAPSFSGFASSHPDTLLRLQRVREEAERLGVPAEGELTPLAIDG